MAKEKGSFGEQMKEDVAADSETSNTKMTSMAGKPYSGAKMPHEHFHDKMASKIGC